MAGEEARLQRLAEKISDGSPIDWEAVEASAESADERAFVRNLRVVSSIAESDASAEPAREMPTLPSAASAEMTIETDEVEPEDLPELTLRRWGHLELRKKVGEGAFGAVYRAWDTRLEREVALKLLHKLDEKDKAIGEAVLREGKLMARVKNPNCVQVYDADEHDGQVGLVMEFIKGRTLADIMKHQGAFDHRQAREIGIDLCRALAAVHRAEIIHHDIKAQNVMREEGGRIVLMDFGAGKEMHEEAGSHGKISGTPLYMPPEVFVSATRSKQSDIYSLGVLLYHLVSGTYPVEAGSMNELRAAHRSKKAKLLRDERSDLPEGFLKAVEGALSWDPADRFQTAGQMEKALAGELVSVVEPEVTSGDSDSTGSGVPRTWIFGLAAAVVVVGLSLILWPRIAGTGTLTPGIPPAGTEARDTDPVSNGSDGPRPRADSGETLEQRLDVPGGSQGTSESDSSLEPEDVPAASLPRKPATPEYTVEAGLFRETETGKERLLSGARVRPGDALFLEFEASEETYVYILNVDAAGEAWSLFPMPGVSTVTNPLSPGVKHELPGARASDLPEGGNQNRWTFTSSHGREEILIMVSPVRQIEIEAELSNVPRPTIVAQGGSVRVSEETVQRFRGMGGIQVSSRPAATSTDGANTMETLKGLAAGAERTTGIWIRQIDLENPPGD